MEREQRRIAAFEGELTKPSMKKRVDKLIERYGLQECKIEVGSSALVYGDNKLRLIFRPTSDEFRSIVGQVRPAQIRYKGLNEDDGGVWGKAYIELGKDITIESDERLFGYSGLDGLCDQLGYKDERRYTGYFGRDTSGQFSS